MKNLFFILLFAPLSIAAQDFYNQDFDCQDFSTKPCNTQTFSVYPNPTTDFFRIGSYTEGVLYAVNGQLLRRVDVRKDVDISDLANGLYFLRVKDRVFKIVKI